MSAQDAAAGLAAPDGATEATVPAAPEAPETSVAESAPEAPAATEPDGEGASPAEPPPAEPAPSEPPVDPPVDPPADPSVDPPAPVESPPPEPEAESPPETEPPPEEPPADEPPAGEPEPPPGGIPESPPETGAAVAQNVSTVLQVILQIQRGCQRYCHGTSQTQEAVQESETTQNASAIGTGDNGAAMALNESRTFQFVWQQQLGCVAFCYDTTQTQFASQTSQTIQTAEAISAAFALALNMSETMQLVWQVQESCREECHGASATQTVNQAQGTDQSAGSSTGSGGPDGVIGWLAALAANIGATLQTIFQYQDADCLENCMGGSQLQRALQQAATTQDATVGETPVGPPAPPTAPPTPSAAPPAETAAAAPEAATAAQSSYVEGRIRRDGDAKRGQASLTEGSSHFSSAAAPPHRAAATDTGAGPGRRNGALAIERPSPTAESGGRGSRPAAASKPGAHANAPIDPSPLEDLGIKLTDNESSPFGDSSLWLALALLALTGVFLAAARVAQAVRM